MPLTITITNAGRAAIVNANNTGTDPVVITQIGISATAHVPAATDIALPGEIKRLATISGLVVADDTLHVSMSDTSTDAYTLRALALYLADGTLFAIYGQADPILVKVAASIAALSVDVTFADIAAEDIAFGDALFVNPPASEAVQGVVQLATLLQAQAGVNSTRPLTPAYAKQAVLGWLLDQDGAGSGLDADKLDGNEASDFALAARTVTGAGLATGGGSLAANRTITVPAASVAEANAGAIADKALTPASITGLLGNIANLLARTITGGGLATGGGSLAANRTITVTAASVAEANAGAIADKALTPASIADLLGNIAALLGRTITGAGLASGGGSLAANRTITVNAASAAEIAAGTVADKAVTPQALAQVDNGYAGSISIRGLGGAITKMGVVYVGMPAGGSVSFPVAFPTACDAVLITPLGNTNEGDERDEVWWVSSVSASGFTVGANGDGFGASFQWVAFGR